LTLIIYLVVITFLKKRLNGGKMKTISKLLLAISFAISVTTSAFAVTAVSWGGAYTESQKLGYGDPTAKALGIELTGLTIQVDYLRSKHKKKLAKLRGILSTYLLWILSMDVTKDYLLNLILTKTSHLHQMELLQVKISLLQCQVNVL
jgi:hypothetical protein